MNESPHVSPFETIRKVNENDNEYWSARDLAKILGYTEYGKFKNAIQKAEEACQNSDQAVSDHFAHVSDMIEVGKGARRKVDAVIDLIPEINTRRSIMPSWQSYLIKPAIRLLSMRLRNKEQTFAEQRAANDAISSPFKFPQDVVYEPTVIDGLPAAWVTPSGVLTEQVILYLHGGAYLLGSLTMYHPTLVTYARATRTRLLMIEYRLAPEHPFPAAVVDARTAYHWLLAQGIRSEQIVVMGDSAGGGLTVALLLTLRDEQIPLPAAAVCLSPWFDLACTGESIRTRARADVILTPQALKKAADAYLGTTDPRTPLASPLYSDLYGLPPMLLQVGTEDILLDDARRFAVRAREAGVSVELQVWSNMIHVWQAFGRRLPEARQAREHIQHFIRSHAPASSPSAPMQEAISDTHPFTIMGHEPFY